MGHWSRRVGFGNGGPARSRRLGPHRLLSGWQDNMGVPFQTPLLLPVTPDSRAFCGPGWGAGNSLGAEERSRGGSPDTGRRGRGGGCGEEEGLPAGNGAWWVNGPAGVSLMAAETRVPTVASSSPLSEALQVGEPHTPGAAMALFTATSWRLSCPGPALSCHHQRVWWQR